VPGEHRVGGDEVGPTPEEIEANAVRARAEAEANAIRGRAEVDATEVVSAAEADAAAIRARAELEVADLRRLTERDRDEARQALAEAREQSTRMISDATDLRRRTEQETLDRLLATRADLHGAIARLTEMTDAVLDITDDLEGAPPEAASEGSSETATEAAPSSGASDDPVGQLMRSAIGRAVDSASAAGRSQRWATDRPARKREQLRDGRSVL
jgi:cell division septum initiation protein DivIVA